MVYGLHGRSWLKCESGGGGKVLNCLHVDFKVHSLNSHAFVALDISTTSYSNGNLKV